MLYIDMLTLYFSGERERGGGGGRERGEVAFHAMY